jgi:hypothetical protein
MEKGFKPFGVLLFLLSVFILLALVSVVFPPGGIPVGTNVHLHFPKVRDIFHPQTPGYADISLLTGHLYREEDSVLMPFTGTLSPEPEKELTGHAVIPVTADEEILRRMVLPLQYPAENDTQLFGFFNSLASIEKTRNLVRIMHYGDSQIENDRISSVLRNRFQTRFEGSGIGMFPVLSPVPHSASVRIRPRGNWVRYTPLSGGLKSEHNRYGLLLSYSALARNPESPLTEGSITLQPSGMGYSRARRMGELKIVFGFNRESFILELRRGEKIIDTGLFLPADSLHHISWILPDYAEEYSLIFRGEGSPEIFMVSIDDSFGVAVDNVPLRGSRGLEFARTDQVIMKKMISDLNVELLILQFGVNVVPGVADDYGFYENSLLRQLRFLKELGNLSIIVIGVSDMSVRTPGGFYESYPNIESVRDAQRNAAFRAGLPFWDLYEAMGGKNSMPSWVAAEPSLGQPDYTHFTYRGSAVVGDLLFNSIIYEYENYLKR